MKIVKFSILFVLICFPLFWVNKLQAREEAEKLQLELKFNDAMNQAVDDAARTLRTSAVWKETEEGYESKKRLELRRDDAVESFFMTLFLNFGLWDGVRGQEELKRYIPVVAIIGYDGLDIYAEEEYVGRSGDAILNHVWKPTLPYGFTDQYGNVIGFTLDDYVTIYHPSSRSWITGYQRELKYYTAEIPLLKDDHLFDSVRRTTIVNTVQNALARTINAHNEIALRNGVSYTFTLPAISEEEWHNTINDVGVMAFIQGLPVGYSTYNHYALGGSRLLKRDNYRGTIINGIKYAFPERCAPTDAIESYLSAPDAAKRGYFIRSCP
ncbi:hypothetical protein [Paenibacillus alvei]|uniref:F0F1-type ATP synthase n=1 Tax=Paenibacillus alvei TaxID=44250 RepID=A0AAP7DJX2_PAEAL|nr:hypothetical protein [Paenibacillus alvei]NOJ72355.1 hypothetical protein [Paenibacillus alvei]